MMRNFKIQQLTHHGFDLLNSRVTKFNYFFTIHTNDMVMLFMTVAFFVLCQVFTELVLFNQIALYQQFQGVINRGAANIMCLFVQIMVEGIGLKVVVTGVYLIEDGKTLNGFAQVLLLQIGREDVLNLVKLFLYVW